MRTRQIGWALSLGLVLYAFTGVLAAARYEVLASQVAGERGQTKASAGNLAGPTAVTLICSAAMNGMIEPCGCQPEQAGGLPRRATLVRSMIAEADTALLIDGGNIVTAHSPNPVVFEEVSRLLQEMGYTAQALGPSDLRLGAKSLAGDGGSARPRAPRIVTNVLDNTGAPISAQSLIAQAQGIAFEIFAVLNSGTVPSEYQCIAPEEALRPRIREAKARGRIPVVISYLPVAELRELVKAIPGIALALVDRPGDDGRPLEPMGRTWLARLPQSGRRLQVLKLTIRGPDVTGVKAEWVDILPTVKRDEKVAQQLKDYYQAHRIAVGSNGAPTLPPAGVAAARTLLSDASQQCATCHATAYTQWSGTHHARAWLTLKHEGATDRADCVGCHTTPVTLGTVGTGLTGVSCGTCHGNGSQHAAQPEKKGLVTRVPDQRLCRTCHTPDSDPKFDYMRHLQAVAH